MRHRLVVLAATLAVAGVVAAVGIRGAGEGSAASAKPAEPAEVIEFRDALPPLDLRGMRLWNWEVKWHPSQWANPNSPTPWRANYIVQRDNADVTLRLDNEGAPQLQALNATPAKRQGLWEADVTLPELTEGVVVAPLWLYDPATKDEIDFEYAGRKGLDVSMHVYVGGVHKQDTVRLFAGQDMSGQRKRFAIRVSQDAGIIDMFVDGRQVYRWTRSQSTFFIGQPLKPRIEMWAADPSNANFVMWVGQWKGLPSGKALAMTVHGYRFTD